MSVAPTVVDNVGAVPPGHLTAAGHVTVYEPVPPCTKRNRYVPPASVLLNVNVQLAVIVTSCELAVEKSIVSVAPLFPALFSSASR